jgi:hypothetical protein
MGPLGSSLRRHTRRASQQLDQSGTLSDTFEDVLGMSDAAVENTIRWYYISRYGLPKETLEISDGAFDKTLRGYSPSEHPLQDEVLTRADEILTEIKHAETCYSALGLDYRTASPTDSKRLDLAALLQAQKELQQ